jgi:hypothetical protein
VSSRPTDYNMKRPSGRNIPCLCSGTLVLLIAKAHHWILLSSMRMGTNTEHWESAWACNDHATTRRRKAGRKVVLADASLCFSNSVLPAQKPTNHSQATHYTRALYMPESKW